jgi:hypothetical protein
MMRPPVPDLEESDHVRHRSARRGDVALIVLSAFWGLLVLFLCIVLVNTFRVLESTKMMIDTVREETILSPRGQGLRRADERDARAGRYGHGARREALRPGRAGGGEPAREDRVVRGRHLEGGEEVPRRSEFGAVRRLFWLALGLGAGAAGAIVTLRFARRQAEKVAPARIAREARGGLMDLAKLVTESLAEGQRAMREREVELRKDLRDAG